MTEQDDKLVPQKRPGKDGLASTKVKRQRLKVKRQRLKEVPVVDLRRQVRQPLRRSKGTPIGGRVTFGGKLILLVFLVSGLTKQICFYERFYGDAQCLNWS